jgi:hypothetical protein
MFSWDGSAQEKRKTGNREQPLADIPDLTFMDNFFQNHLVVDLSHTLNPDIPCWPGDPVTEFETGRRGRLGIGSSLLLIFLIFQTLPSWTISFRTTSSWTSAIP